MGFLGGWDPLSPEPVSAAQEPGRAGGTWLPAIGWHSPSPSAMRLKVRIMGRHRARANGGAAAPDPRPLPPRALFCRASGYGLLFESSQAPSVRPALSFACGNAAQGQAGDPF